MDSYKIEMESTFEAVDLAVAEILIFLHKQCCLINKQAAFAVNFALRELLINAIEHGNRKIKEKKVTCIVNFTKSYITIEVIDEGKGFDLNALKCENEKDENGVVRERGRGICTLLNMGFCLDANKNHITAKLELSGKNEKGDLPDEQNH